ncbi:hypothetical protein TRIUR3_06571 [Triticum urartu]|uniref:Uncharacterized protein n=1 Tax=Triticum urartu TaxID=4572 RepID=M7ZY26_TRIUA|nr:hypothetical protein TRIUR3_06571 [Triticum urartu]
MAGREQDGDGGEAAGGSSVLSGEYQAQEMSTMVSALARVVSGGDGGWADDGWEGHPAMGGYVHAQGGCYPAAPTPDQLAAGEDRDSLRSLVVYCERRMFAFAVADVRRACVSRAESKAGAGG